MSDAVSSVRLATVFVAFTLSCALWAQDWKPGKNVEIIVATTAGGGNDKTARTIQAIWQNTRALGSSSTVVNKPGGGGAIATNYLNQHAGDGHYIGIASPSLLTTHITGVSPSTYTDVTPIALLFSEYIAFAVRADSPLKSGAELIEKLRKDPTSLAIATAPNFGGPNDTAIALALKASGGDVRRLKIVVYQSTGEAMVALLGGHVDMVPSVASNLLPHYQAGKMRLLAIAAPQRLPGPLSNVPTWREQGIEAVSVNWRVAVGPRSMSRQQVAYWEGTFAKLSKNEEWRSDLERNLWVDSYMTSEETRKYLASQYDQFKDVLTALGLSKSPEAAKVSGKK